MWQYLVTVSGIGRVGFPVPLPSELLLRVGDERLQRATKLRAAALTSATAGGFIRPADVIVSNHQLIFDFFQEAMAGVVLVHATLNNFASERIPRSGADVDGKHRDRGALIHTGIENRLSRVLAAATGKVNLKTERPDLWVQIEHLKDLRDAIQYAQGGSEGYVPSEEEDTIFAKLLNERDLTALGSLVREIIDLYREPDSGGTTAGTATSKS